ncbi:MAG: sodium:solute symporter [Opitutales bacterium]
MTIEYLVLGVYLALVLVLGGIFSKFTRSLSDFVRGGAQGTWWMIGMSMFIAGISAFTFTGNASAVFEAGPTPLIIYAGNSLAFIVCGLGLAAWLRQTRAYTVADVIRERFGVTVEQVSAYFGLFIVPVSGSIQLWALANFAGSTFDFPLEATIIVIGLFVMIYSTSGGKWAVVATDFVQGLIMMAITVVVMILSLNDIGGIGGFFEGISRPDIAEDYRFVKEPGAFEANKFSLLWIIVIFFNTMHYQVSLTASGRFLMAKDGNEAKKGAWLAAILMAGGAAIWFIPPMIARVLYGDEIMAQTIDNPAAGSYAYIAFKLLPAGLTGLLIAAMFAATMSSLDSALNGQVGTVVRNIIPRFLEWRKLPPMSQRLEVSLCRILTLALGALIIWYSLQWAKQTEIVLFDAYLVISSVVGLPLGLPMLAGLFVRRLWKYSYFVIAGMCLLPSLWAFVSENYFDQNWTIQGRILWIFIFGALGTLLSVYLARFDTDEYREKERAFFTKMKTPVDFAKEVGEDLDDMQGKLMGNSAMVLGGLLALTVFIPNPWTGRLWCLAVAGGVAGVGYLLKRNASRGKPVPSNTTSE